MPGSVITREFDVAGRMLAVNDMDGRISCAVKVFGTMGRLLGGANRRMASRRVISITLDKVHFAKKTGRVIGREVKLYGTLETRWGVRACSLIDPRVVFIFLGGGPIRQPDSLDRTARGSAPRCNAATVHRD